MGREEARAEGGGVLGGEGEAGEEEGSGCECWPGRRCPRQVWLLNLYTLSTAAAVDCGPQPGLLHTPLSCRVANSVLLLDHALSLCSSCRAVRRYRGCLERP